MVYWVHFLLQANMNYGITGTAGSGNHDKSIGDPKSVPALKPASISQIQSRHKGHLSLSCRHFLHGYYWVLMADCNELVFPREVRKVTCLALVMLSSSLDAPAARFAG